jgi:predicted HAD superfamily Cof-like phosphohydrolase
MSMFHTQYEFMQAGDISGDERKLVELSLTLVAEEANEFEEAINVTMNNKEVLYSANSLKECIDLIYVCCQYMNTCVGPDKAEALFNLVHSNNMSKCQDGKLVKGANGKVLKPEGFKKLTDDDIFAITEGVNQ